MTLLLRLFVLEVQLTQSLLLLEVEQPVEVRDLDPGLTIDALAGVVTNPFAGLNNWYEVGGTTTFTISGDVTGDTTFTIVTRGSSCNEVVYLIPLSLSQTQRSQTLLE